MITTQDDDFTIRFNGREVSVQRVRGWWEREFCSGRMPVTTEEFLNMEMVLEERFHLKNISTVSVQVDPRKRTVYEVNPIEYYMSPSRPGENVECEIRFDVLDKSVVSMSDSGEEAEDLSSYLDNE